MIRRAYIDEIPFGYRCIRRARYRGPPVELEVIYELVRDNRGLKSTWKITKE